MEESGHLERSLLIALAGGRLPRSHRVRAARHLKACPSCKEELSRLWESRDGSSGGVPGWPPRQPAYGAAVARALDRLNDLLTRRLRDDAAKDGAASYREPAHPEPSGWRTGDAGQARRQGPLALCNLLLEGSLKAMLERPETARDLAERAIEVATARLPGSPRAALLRDVQARGWACLGYLHHRREDHAAAEAAFGRAEACLQEGTGDPLEEAHVLQLEALWAESRGDAEEAEWLLDREADLYAAAGHRRLQGRSFIHRASLRARAGELAQAVRLCREGVALLDPRTDHELAATARRDLLHYLDAAGELRQARDLAAGLAIPGGPSWASAELRRVEGKIARLHGRRAAAAAAFAAAQRAFLRLGEIGEAARVTLDLAAVLCHRRRSAGCGRLGELIGPLLEAPELAAEARAALQRLQQAAAVRGVTPELVDELAAELAAEDHPEAYLALGG